MFTLPYSHQTEKNVILEKLNICPNKNITTPHPQTWIQKYPHPVDSLGIIKLNIQFAVGRLVCTQCGMSCWSYEPSKTSSTAWQTSLKRSLSQAWSYSVTSRLPLIIRKRLLLTKRFRIGDGGTFLWCKGQQACISRLINYD